MVLPPGVEVRGECTQHVHGEFFAVLQRREPAYAALWSWKTGIPGRRVVRLRLCSSMRTAWLTSGRMQMYRGPGHRFSVVGNLAFFDENHAVGLRLLDKNTLVLSLYGVARSAPPNTDDDGSRLLANFQVRPLPQGMSYRRFTVPKIQFSPSCTPESGSTPFHTDPADKLVSVSYAVLETSSLNQEDSEEDFVEYVFRARTLLAISAGVESEIVPWDVWRLHALCMPSVRGEEFALFGLRAVRLAPRSDGRLLQMADMHPGRIAHARASSGSASASVGNYAETSSYRLQEVELPTMQSGNWWPKVALGEDALMLFDGHWQSFRPGAVSHGSLLLVLPLCGHTSLLGLYLVCGRALVYILSLGRSAPF